MRVWLILAAVLAALALRSAAAEECAADADAGLAVHALPTRIPEPDLKIGDLRISHGARLVTGRELEAFRARKKPDNTDAFCCWSDLWVEESDGRARIWAVSDKKRWMILDLELRADGQACIARARVGRMPLGNREEPESLVRRKDGTWLVGTECDKGCGPDEARPGTAPLVKPRHKLFVFPGDAGADVGLNQRPIAEIPLPDAFIRQPGDKGPEGMAVLDDGRIVVFAERYDAGEGTKTATAFWISENAIPGREQWTEYRYDLRSQPADASYLAGFRCDNGPCTFKVSGLTLIDPDKQELLVLEREHQLGTGVAFRLKTIDRTIVDNAEGVKTGRPYHRAETFQPLGQKTLTDNFEGVAWVRGAARPTLWLLSDNNGTNGRITKCDLRPPPYSIDCQRTLLLRLQLD